MTPFIREKAALLAISPSSLAAYLIAAGWTKGPAVNGVADIWLSPGDQAQELLLPRSGEVADYATRIAEVLQGLATFEARSEYQIASAIALADADVIRIRRGSDDVAHDSIALGDASWLVDSAQDMMAAAAATAVHPRRVLPSRRPNQASDYLRHVQFGQTERGSFILTIVSRVEPLLTPGSPGLEQLWDDPFPRRVVKTLFRSLAATRHAIDLAAGGGSLQAFEQAVDVGVSANLCTAIAGLVAGAGASGGIRASLSWAVATPVLEEVPLAASFDVTHLDILADAASFLRQASPLAGLQLTGVVVNLHREEGADTGVATISCVIEGTVRQLLVPLDATNHQVAIVAYRDQHGVLFKADVRQVGRQYRASAVQTFSLIK